MAPSPGDRRGGALSSSSSRRTALALAAELSLPSLLLLWLASRAGSFRWRAPGLLKRRRGGEGAVLLAALLPLLLARPVKLLLRALRGEGRLASDAPGRLPFLGHILFLNSLPSSKPGIWDLFTGLHARLGSTIRLVAGPEFFPFRVFHFTNDASNVEHILKRNFDNYGKGREVEHVFKEFLGQGIFVVDGERWREQRKTAAAIFSRKNFGENMTGVFQAHARHLISVLRRGAARQPHDEVELQELFFSLTLDAFCEIGFGVPWNSMEGGEDAADGPALAEGPSSAVLREWARHFDAAQHVIVTRFAYRPLWRLERALSLCGLLPAGRDESRFVRSIRFMNGVVGQLLDHRFQRADGRARADLLSLFMEGTRDRAYLRDIVMSFIIAGRDTTACTLTWLFWELAQSPEALARAEEEILQVASEEQRSDGGAGSVSDFTFEQLGRLKFATACVRETVRLHPPVPADPKVAFGDDALPDGSLIARGDYVFFEPYMMARDPSNWGADAAEWRPERWLEMEREPSAYVNCAFQAGPRICLGRDMAILEVRAVLVQAVLSGLRWEVRAGYAPTYRYPSLVLPMAKPGLPARIYFAGAPSSIS